jgi:DNA repair photolyase
MPQIYEPQGKAREYSPLALNHIKGCDYGCLYCYVPKMISIYNKNYFHYIVDLRIDLKSIELSAKKFEGCGKQILLNFISDPYNRQITHQTRDVLKILNKYNHLVAILTKAGEKVLNDLDVFKAFGNRIKIGSTLTFDNEHDSRYYEHGAAIPVERIEMLKSLKREGIKTWVSFEPVIIPKQTIHLIELASFVDHVKIGKLNNYKNIDKRIDWSKFLNDAVNVCRKNRIKFYIKSDLQKYNSGTILSKNEIDQDYLNLKPDKKLQDELF